MEPCIALHIRFHGLFIYLIPEDVLPGDSKAIGIICALKNRSYPESDRSYPELYSPDDDDGEELVWEREKKTKKKKKKQKTLLCCLKANSLESGQNIKMTVFAFWFDSNKKLNYPFFWYSIYARVGFHDPGQFLYRNY